MLRLSLITWTLVLGLTLGAPVGAQRQVSGASPTEIFSVAVDGKGKTNLTHDPDVDSHPIVSPNGKRVVYVRESFDPTVTRELWVMNANGTSQRQLTALATGEASDPVWSPDGSKVAFSESTPCQPQPGVVKCALHDVYVVDVDHGMPNRVARDGQLPTWAPDSTRVVFETRVDPDGLAHGLGIANVKSGGYRLLLAGSKTFREPTWSPRGGTILFARWPTGGVTSTLMVVGSNGRGLRRLTSGREARWSPDGRRVVFESGRSSIDVTGADGRGRRRLATIPGSLLFGPQWSHDGGAIAFYAVPARGGAAGLYSAKSGRSGPSRRVVKVSDESGFDWSPRADRIYYASS